ncbi:MAG TPA: hypothetical protein VIB48_08315 [Acidimicrobiia bacterium]
MTDDNHDGPVERALDVLVYAPLGLAALARDTVPGLLQGFAARGRAELERRRHNAQEKVTQARAVGRFALDYGAPMVRQKVERHITEARGRAEQTFTGLVIHREDAFGNNAGAVDSAVDVVEASEDEPVDTASLEDAADAAIPASSAPAASHAGGTNGAGAGIPPSPSGLPIPDYDELSASQVVSRLPGLGLDELEAIRTYETHGRGRRTILGKIDQLVR